MANSNPNVSTRFKSGPDNPARRAAAERKARAKKLEQLHETASTPAILLARLRSLTTPASSLQAIASAYRTMKDLEAGDEAHAAALAAKDAEIASRDAEIAELRRQRIEHLQQMLDVDRTTPVAGGAQFAADGVAPGKLHPRAEPDSDFLILPPKGPERIQFLIDATKAELAERDAALAARSPEEKMQAMRAKAAAQQDAEWRRAGDNELPDMDRGCAWLSQQSAALSRSLEPPPPPFSAVAAHWKRR